MGKLIVIDGLDGCGKTTQCEMAQEKILCTSISFPNYSDRMGQIIRHDYLEKGYYDPDMNTSIYGSSLLYSIDRYLSYHKDWKKLYSQENSIILSARYTSSNLALQAAKLPTEKWDEYADWLLNIEQVKLGLPEPDVIIFIDIPIDVSQKMLSNRYNGDESKKDLHESNIEYMKRCRVASLYMAKKYNWYIVSAVDKDNNLRSIDDINTDIMKIIEGVI